MRLQAILAFVVILAFAPTSATAQTQAHQPPVAVQASSNPGTSGNQAESPNPKKAEEAYKRGQSAEKAEDWAAAFAGYAEAAKNDPSNREYAMRREFARSQLVSEAVERAERFALLGQDEQARKELTGALVLDPGNQIVRQRLALLAPDAKAALHQLLVQPGGLIRLEPLTGSRNLKFSGNTTSAYEEVARQFGVEASFDVDLVPRPVRLDLQNVDFLTAMQALGEMTGTFWRPLTQRLFFITSDTPEKRRQYDASVVRTAQLPASVTPTDMTEMLRVVRTIAGISRADLNLGTREITLRATPQAVAVASRLLDQLEQPQGELVLEMEVLEVDRTAARQLGITPPESATTFSLTPQELQTAEQSPQGLISVIQQLFGSTSATSGLSASQIAALVSSGQLSLGSLIPPLVAFGGGKTTFLATLPGAAVSLSETLNLVRRGRRILLRAQDGKPVTFFVGERVPITLATFSANLGTSHFVPTVTSDVFPRTDIPTGIDPLAVAAADFDGDGNQDLAVANHGDNTVSILLGRGDGTFSIGTPQTAGNQPVAIVSADFNGDGHPDLAVVNQEDNTVSIFLGNGDGTFTLKGTLPTGSNPVAIAAADFNGDGRADLAVVNQGTTTAPGNSVSIFLGNGDGTFTTGSVLTTGRTPSAITAAPLVSGSNVEDLAVTNQADNTVSVFLGKGDGTFTLQGTLSTGTTPDAIVAAEFHTTTSSNMDLAVANQADNTVSLFLGNGDGTFSAATSFATGTSPVALSAADFNIDGQQDLAVSDQTANTVSILIGNGDGTFAPRLDLGTGSGPAGLVATTLTSNGRPDLAVADSTANTVTVLLNNASFSTPTGAPPLNLFPNAEYQDVGLKIKATPHMSPNGEATIQMSFELRSLTGDSVNGIPVISDQSVDQIVRVKDEETTALAGMLETQQMNTITGTPGLAALGSLGRIASKHSKQDDRTELLILVTPRILRLGPTTGKPIFAGRAPVGSGAAFTPPAVRPQP